ncbi:hypothetical protein OA977_02840 [Pelagibacteraceae bacterium]|nr:hypothetical protein [Pelagibacteraceae bacterium]
MNKLSLIVLFVALNTFNVQANHIPESLFGIKLNHTLSFDDITEYIYQKNNADGEEEWLFNKAGIDKILANNESYTPNSIFMDMVVTTDTNKTVTKIQAFNAKQREPTVFESIQDECKQDKAKIKNILETKHNIKFTNKLLTSTDANGVIFMDYDYIIHKGQNTKLELVCNYYSKNYFKHNNLTYFLGLYLSNNNYEGWSQFSEVESIDFDLLFTDSSGL